LDLAQWSGGPLPQSERTSPHAQALAAKRARWLPLLYPGMLTAIRVYGDHSLLPIHCVHTPWAVGLGSLTPQEYMGVAFLVEHLVTHFPILSHT